MERSSEAPAAASADPLASMTAQTIIESAWKDFEAKVMPPAASEIQRRDMRMAFFAGATTVVSVMETVGEPGTSMETGFAMLKGLHNEIKGFIKGFIKELAP